MQVDFHHAVTYVLARLAGFSKNEAEIVAYSAQYVDDATESGVVEFDNGARFHYEGAAHKPLDYRSYPGSGRPSIWLPFHFLPGNMGLGAGKEPGGKFINKLICRPNSPVAQDMVNACLANRGKSYGLHLLGITSHVYADTWAHQGFAGVNHIVNVAEELRSNNLAFDDAMRETMGGRSGGDLPPLGHDAVLTYPDQPYLVWEYTNGFGERLRRDNPRDYMQTVDYLFHVLVSYKQATTSIDFKCLAPVPEEDRQAISSLFKTLTDDNGERRHRAWLDAIAEGRFGFGGEVIGYQADEDRWKLEALKPAPRGELGVFAYSDDFLSSNWKLFHDALTAHRFAIIHEILPRYRICAG